MNICRLVTRSLAIFGLAILLIGCVAAPKSASAQSYNFGQSHSYDVHLRGNGSAVVNARIAITNTEEKPVKTFRYSVANGTLSDVTAIQEIACYDLPVYMPMDRQTSSGNQDVADAPATIQNRETVTTTTLPECYEGNNSTAKTLYDTKGRQPTDYYMPVQSSIYKKVPVTLKNNSFTLTLPREIAFDETANVILIYNLSGVAKKQMGVYEYSFKTLSTNVRISNSTVAVSVDNDYVLEGSADNKVIYNPETSGADISQSLREGLSLNADSQSSTSAYIGSIGTNGTVTKTTSNLAAGETMNVTGRYATNEFLLHWPRTILRFVLGIIFVVAIISWYVHRRKQLKQKQAHTTGTSNDEVSPSALTTIPKDSKTSNKSTTPIEQQSVSKVAQKSSFLTIDVRALPFYAIVSRFLGKLQARGLSYPLFGWMCAFLTLLLLGGVLWAFAALPNQQDYYYGHPVSTMHVIITTGIGLCLSMIAFLGVILFTIGLPFLYAPNLKTALRIITNIVLFSIFMALLLFAYQRTLVDNTANNCQQYPYSYDCGTIEPQDSYLKSQ